MATAIFAPPSGLAQSNPLASRAVDAGAGFLAGMTYDRAGQYIKSTRTRANWALGIGVVLLAIEAAGSSGLSQDQSNATAIMTATSALTFTTAGGVTGEEVSALRAQVVALSGVVAQTAYDSNPFAYSGRPASPAQTVTIASITQPATTTQVASNGLLFAALAALVIVALIWSGSQS